MKVFNAGEKMTKQLCCIINPKNEKQYYSFFNDGILALREVGKRDALIEYDVIEELLIHQVYEDVIIVDADGIKKHSREINNEMLYEKDYTMQILGPWLSVFEKYGTNGCIYNLDTGKTKLFFRENYHAEVSSFSNALFIYNEQFCLLHQTQWNRLDITNLDTGELLTDREVYYRRLDNRKQNNGINFEEKNYKDYFHGKIFFSPDYKYFVDTGWVWHPVGVPILYCVENFIEGYENTCIDLRIDQERAYSYDWDQSAIWLNNESFLLDFFPDSDLLEDCEIVKNNYQVLLKYNIKSIMGTQPKYLVANEIIDRPFATTNIESASQMDLYWDIDEQLLIGIDKNYLSIWDKTNELVYSIKFGESKCYYFVEHHIVYTENYGSILQRKIRELLKISKGFRFE